MKINNFQGELTDISATKEALLVASCNAMLLLMSRKPGIGSRLHLRIKHSFYQTRSPLHFLGGVLIKMPAYCGLACDWMQCTWCVSIIMISLYYKQFYETIVASVVYRITSKYSNALRTSQTCSFAKWYNILHPKGAFEAPWSCVRCGVKYVYDIIMHSSSSPCWKTCLFEYLAAIRYTMETRDNGSIGHTQRPYVGSDKLRTA